MPSRPTESRLHGCGAPAPFFNLTLLAQHVHPTRTVLLIGKAPRDAREAGVDIPLPALPTGWRYLRVDVGAPGFAVLRREAACIHLQVAAEFQPPQPDEALLRELGELVATFGVDAVLVGFNPSWESMGRAIAEAGRLPVIRLRKGAFLFHKAGAGFPASPSELGPASADAGAEALSAGTWGSVCGSHLERLFEPAEAASGPSRLRVASILDEFSCAAFKDVCDIKQLTPTGWQAELEAHRPELFLVESAWRGQDGLWERMVAQQSEALLGILDWCREHGVPRVFWNKEDPVHYNTFLNLAKRVDHVFTTDLDCISAYKRDLGHDRVSLLGFACNPADTNPVEVFNRKARACFAGSYYVRYPERARDLDVLLGVFDRFDGVDIYDRNHGKVDENYAFPERYRERILGNLPFERIHEAYKGYRFGINLNSVKHSPTMFARRVYELVASNTTVVSNYSRGLRLQFGDLVIGTDDGAELEARIREVSNSSATSSRRRYVALRKVLSEHTYGHRLRHVVARALPGSGAAAEPLVLVVACVQDLAGLSRVLQQYRWQTWGHRKLMVHHGMTDRLPATLSLRPDELLDSSMAPPCGACHPDFTHVALFRDGNYYGPDYLTDLVLATRYAGAPIVAKGILQSAGAGAQVAEEVISGDYRHGRKFAPEAALLDRSSYYAMVAELGCEKPFDGRYLPAERVLYIPKWDFARWPGAMTPEAAIEAGISSALPGLWTGVSQAALVGLADRVPPAPAADLEPGPDEVRGDWLAQFATTAYEGEGVTAQFRDGQLHVALSESPPERCYLYSRVLEPVEKIWPDRSGKFHLRVTPGIEVQPVVFFLNDKRERISHAINIANWNQAVQIPETCRYVRLALRLAGRSGASRVTSWVFHHLPEVHRFSWVPKGRVLLVAPSYPDYGDYYRYGFVHRRVKAYKARGLHVDVVRFRPAENLRFYEFEGVDVVAGGEDVLNTVLRDGRYQHVMVHALDERMWAVLSRHHGQGATTVWCHGAEIQAWHRREALHQTDEERRNARALGEKRDAFWRKLLAERQGERRFVFVSNQFRDEVLADLGVSPAAGSVEVIPNPIDTTLFHYRPKPAAQRRRVLSIRPYASRVYANDVMVRAVLALSREAIFPQLHFTIVGDGPLFAETVEPLRAFDNVDIRQGFVSQTEIAALHRDHGVFLCPTRMDTQGVSRDEAMSSGLVPVTNRIGAVPEFLPEDAGFLCEPEDPRALAAAILRLNEEPKLFAAMSARAAALIRATRSNAILVPREMDLVVGR